MRHSDAQNFDFDHELNHDGASLSKDRRQALKAGMSVLATGLIGGLTACSTASNFTDLIKPPTFEVQDVELLSASRTSQVMRFKSLLGNQNSISLPIQNAALALKVAGVDMGQVQLPQAVTIPAGSASLTNFDVQTDLLRAISQLGGLRSVGPNTPLPYDLDGRVGVTSANLSFPMRHRGEFTLAQLGRKAFSLIGLPF